MKLASPKAFFGNFAEKLTNIFVSEKYLFFFQGDGK